MIRYVFETRKYAGSLDFEELKLKRSYNKQFSCNFNVRAADSKKNQGGMVSDFVAGLCKDIFRNKNSVLKGIMNIKYISKFPHTDFDKDIKQIS
ncbi:hypothetical protein NSA50_19620 [Clostridium sp. DSM 100503]|uniref:hypothetical protein n=1 Tax=Clostridium sp. DSM 100503 TaxID=2963282 RepID=UPI002149FFFA|nr:hypothetical protein [Clostridium sp. DSM 100503]MCR1953198.1 hypothetical protein [Clostridium sp. DSM 100503]